MYTDGVDGDKGEWEARRKKELQEAEKQRKLEEKQRKLAERERKRGEREQARLAKLKEKEDKKREREERKKEVCVSIRFAIILLNFLMAGAREKA